jgi:hypothetical protein
VCPNPGIVLCFAGVFSLVVRADLTDDQNRHSGAKIGDLNASIWTHAITMKAPGYGQGLVARIDNARQLRKISFIHHGIRE